MKQYTVELPDGFRVGVTEGGDGIPLVFLHGFSVSASAYTEMLELLAANGFHVYAFDLPGHGGTDILPVGHSVEDMADVIGEALLHIPTLEGARAVLAGHSMGGALAASLADRPRYSSFSFDTLILMDAALGRAFHNRIDLSHKPSIPIKAAQFVAGALWDVWGDTRKARSLRTLRERLDFGKRLGESVSGLACLRAGKALMAFDSLPVLDRLGRSRVKVHVVHGEFDTLIPAEAAIDTWEALGARNPRAVLHVVHGAYHSWMIADPRLALDVVQGCLDLTLNEEGDGEAV